MSKSPREWAKLMVKELYKHAQRDDCYDCKQVLRKMGLDPDKKEPFHTKFEPEES